LNLLSLRSLPRRVLLLAQFLPRSARIAVTMRMSGSMDEVEAMLLSFVSFRLDAFDPVKLGPGGVMKYLPEMMQAHRAWEEVAEERLAAEAEERAWRAGRAERERYTWSRLHDLGKEDVMAEYKASVLELAEARGVDKRMVSEEMLQWVKDQVRRAGGWSEPHEHAPDAILRMRAEIAELLGEKQ
jgi:hypothetical protein